VNTGQRTNRGEEIGMSPPNLVESIQALEEVTIVRDAGQD
jgi:hypothetical protein